MYEKVLKKTFLKKVLKKSNTRLKYPWNSTPTHNISKASSKVYLGNANRVPHKDVLKPHSIVTCNLTHKAAKIPHAKLDICKPFNNQSSTLSPKVIRSSGLNTHKQQSPANIRKPSCSVTKLSQLKAHKSANQKLHQDCGFDTNNESANHLHYKLNHLWWKYHIKKFLFLSSYLCNFCFYHVKWIFLCW